ncbi:MAG: hypothetical protein COY81_03500 [Candidatus Pacebacteria bacterium CG_4_10_14_0_8_um_filter_43_12]|nr:MAG: hypothetical protein COU66_02200 [Candidatus Pacebacteria bacterium CG10_big_fil_rev_8_21_14_0_10_44_11]PIY79275.1 MAG: hypothetical protein COY81_03500 [Candidatus Pacebacteria bacterium CG_4_10_14_0_8_um_filter_43_12]
MLEQINKQPLVLVTGVFDLLHSEHLIFLNKAKALGSLIIAIESDERVRELKGFGRPINKQAVRKHNLEKLGLACKILILPKKFSQSANHRRLLQKIKPDILAVSSHTPHLKEKASLMQEIGGRVEIVHQHNPAVSTTLVLKNQRKGW